MNDTQALLASLPQTHRLALAYAAGASVRLPMLGVFALDARLAAALRGAREPMLAQVRLAWWREQLGRAPGAGSSPDTCLAALADWPADRALLVDLVNAWEGMIGGDPLSDSTILQLATARGAALACLTDARDETLRQARNWALWDIACHLTQPQEIEAVLKLARAQDWEPCKLPRAMRPIAMLHGLARRRVQSSTPCAALSAGDYLALMRFGLLGR